MSAHTEVRGMELLGAESADGVAGTLTVGPFAHPAFVYEIGALVTATITIADETVTSPAGDFSIPVDSIAGTVVRKAAVGDDTAGVVTDDGPPVTKVSSAQGKHLLAPNETLVLTGGGDHTAGTYHLYAMVILHAHNDVIEG